MNNAKPPQIEKQLQNIGKNEAIDSLWNVYCIT
jgi:hypothetical protein